MDTKRRKIQLELAFMTEGRSETPKAVGKGTELSVAKRKSEDQALPILLSSLVLEVFSSDSYKIITEVLTTLTPAPSASTLLARNQFSISSFPSPPAKPVPISPDYPDRTLSTSCAGGYSFAPDIS